MTRDHRTKPNDARSSSKFGIQYGLDLTEHKLNDLQLDHLEMRTLVSFIEQYPTIKECEKALSHARWPNGFQCPRCEYNVAYYISTRHLYQCRNCRHQTSLTSGTILENSRTDLMKWFLAFFLVSQLGGINALDLQKALRVTYKTAWAILAKIRHALTHAHESNLLSGIVRINTTTYNSRYYHPIYLRRGEHAVMIGGSLNAQNEPTEIKIKRAKQVRKPNRDNMSLATSQFSQQFVDPAAEDVRVIHFSPRNIQSLMAVSIRASNWIANTFGGIGPKHLQSYLNEYCTRFNIFQSCFKENFSSVQPMIDLNSDITFNHNNYTAHNPHDNSKIHPKFRKPIVTVII